MIKYHPQRSDPVWIETPSKNSYQLAKIVISLMITLKLINICCSKGRKNRKTCDSSPAKSLRHPRHPYSRTRVPICV